MRPRHNIQPEKLSPALLRPGRVDKKFHFGLASQEQAELLFNQFFPQACASQRQTFVNAIPEDTFSVAEVT